MPKAVDLCGQATTVSMQRSTKGNIYSQHWTFLRKNSDLTQYMNFIIERSIRYPNHNPKLLKR